MGGDTNSMRVIEVLDSDEEADRYNRCTQDTGTNARADFVNPSGDDLSQNCTSPARQRSETPPPSELPYAYPGVLSLLLWVRKACQSERDQAAEGLLMWRSRRKTACGSHDLSLCDESEAFYLDSYNSACERLQAAEHSQWERLGHAVTAIQ